MNVQHKAAILIYIRFSLVQRLYANLCYTVHFVCDSPKSAAIMRNVIPYILRVQSDIHCECLNSIAYVTCTIDIEYSQWISEHSLNHDMWLQVLIVSSEDSILKISSSLHVVHFELCDEIVFISQVYEFRFIIVRTWARMLTWVCRCNENWLSPSLPLSPAPNAHCRSTFNLRLHTSVFLAFCYRDGVCEDDAPRRGAASLTRPAAFDSWISGERTL